MNQVALEEEIHRLRKELQLAGSDIESRFLDLRAEVDRLRLELKAVRKFLTAAHPSFGEEFPRVLEHTIREVDPEFD